MTRYPETPLNTIGVTAPSSGVSKDLHHLIHEAAERLMQRGIEVEIGKTVWTQCHAKSASAEKRGRELMDMFHDDHIDAIMPPWGGELLIEVLEFLDFETIPPK